MVCPMRFSRRRSSTAFAPGPRPVIIYGDPALYPAYWGREAVGMWGAWYGMVRPAAEQTRTCSRGAIRSEE